MSNIVHILKQYKELQDNITQQGDKFANMLKQVQQFQVKRLQESHPDLFNDNKKKSASEFLFLGVYTDPDLRKAMNELCDKASALSLIPGKVLGSLMQSIEALTATDHADQLAAQGLIDNNIEKISLETYLDVLRKNTTHDLRVNQFNKIKVLGAQMDDTLRSRMLKGAMKLAKKPMEAAGLGATHHFISQSIDIVGSVNSTDEITRAFAEKEIAFSAKVYAGDPNPYVI